MTIDIEEIKNQPRDRAVERISERYETMRQACLRVGHLHPDSKSVCHQALEHARNIPDGATHELALLADDLKLFIDQLQAENAALRKELEEARNLLAYTVKEADGWHDESRGGPITGDVTIDAARRVADSKHQG